MKSILLFITAVAAYAQTAVFPGAVATDSQLKVAANGITTLLTAPLNNSQTNLTVSACAGIGVNMLITIDSEIMPVSACSGTALTVLSRGYDNTSPAAHAASSQIGVFIDAWHHNALKAEVEAVETALGANLSNVASLPLTSSYIFTPQIPSISLSPGSNTINISPGIKGLSGSDTSHYLYVSGGTGTAEACLVTGGTATSGNPGTILMTCANSHSGAWTISSVMCGIPEAINAAGAVSIPAGSCSVHGPAYMPADSVLKGQGFYATSLNIAADFPLSVGGVFIGQTGLSGNGPEMSGFNVTFSQPDSTNISLYTHWPPAFYMFDCGRFTLTNILIQAAWDGVVMTGNSGGAHLNDIWVSAFDKAIWIDGSEDSNYLSQIHNWPFGLTANQIQVMWYTSSVYGLYCGRSDDLHITDFFSEAYTGIYFFAGETGPAYGTYSNIALDTASSLVITAGDHLFNGLRVTLNVGVKPHVSVSQASSSYTTQVNFVNTYLFPGTCSGSGPMVQINSGTVQWDNGRFFSQGCDNVTIQENYVNTGSLPGTLLTLTNGQYHRYPDTVYANPTISVLGGRATVIGNRTDDLGVGGSGNFISIANDDWHQIRANSFVAWGHSYPSNAGGTASFGTYESDNNTFLFGPQVLATSCAGLPNGTLYNYNGIVTFCPETPGGGGGSVTAATVSHTFTGNQSIAFTHGLNAVDGSSNPIAPTMTCTDVTAGVAALLNSVTITSANVVTLNYTGSPSTVSCHFVF